MKFYTCKGMEIEPGIFSGCDANKTHATDCPVCDNIRKVENELTDALSRRKDLRRPTDSWLAFQAADEEIEQIEDSLHKAIAAMASERKAVIEFGAESVFPDADETECVHYVEGPHKTACGSSKVRTITDKKERTNCGDCLAVLLKNGYVYTSTADMTTGELTPDQIHMQSVAHEFEGGNEGIMSFCKHCGEIVESAQHSKEYAEQAAQIARLLAQLTEANTNAEHWEESSKTHEKEVAELTSSIAVIAKDRDDLRALEEMFHNAVARAEKAEAQLREQHPELFTISVSSGLNATWNRPDPPAARQAIEQENGK